MKIIKIDSVHSMSFSSINGRPCFLFQVRIYMILRLVGYFLVVIGQPSEPLLMPSVVHEEVDQEVLQNQHMQEEKQIDNRNPHQNRNHEVGRLTYPVIF